MVIDKLKREFAFLKGNFLIILITWIIIDFTSDIPRTYYPLYVIALGATPFILGLISAIYVITLSIVQIPGGYLADKIGRKKLIITMTYGVGIAYFIIAFAPSWHYVLIGFMVMGFCLIYQPALLAIVADSVPAERRGMAYSIVNFIVSSVSIPSPIIAGLLLKQFGLVNGMRIAYTLAGLSLIIAAIIRLKLVETLPTKSTTKVTIREVLSSYTKLIREYGEVRSSVSGPINYLLLVGVLITLGSALCQDYWILYAVNILGLSKLAWAYIMTWFAIVTLVVSIPCGKLIDVFGRKTSLVISCLVSLIAIILFIYGDYYRVLMSFTLSALGTVLFRASFDALLADYVPTIHRGKVLGLFNTLSYIVSSVAYVLGGYLYQYVNPQAPFIALYCGGEAIKKPNCRVEYNNVTFSPLVMSEP